MRHLITKITFPKRICETCCESYTPTGARQKHCKKCRLIAIHNYKKTYKKSTKGKLAEKRYRHSVKGKAYMHRQNTTEKHKEQSRRYCRSLAGKETAKRYHSSAKGIATRKRARSKEHYKVCQKVRNVFKWCLASKKLDTPYKNLGYTPREAIEHIKALLIPGMVFSDKSTWCIHHIKPISSFVGTLDNIIQTANQLKNIVVLTHEEHNELHSTLKRYENKQTPEDVLQLILNRRK